MRSVGARNGEWRKACSGGVKMLTGSKARLQEVEIDGNFSDNGASVRLAIC